MVVLVLNLYMYNSIKYFHVYDRVPFLIYMFVSVSMFPSVRPLVSAVSSLQCMRLKWTGYQSPNDCHSSRTIDERIALKKPIHFMSLFFCFSAVHRSSLLTPRCFIAPSTRTMSLRPRLSAVPCQMPRLLFAKSSDSS